MPSDPTPLGVVLIGGGYGRAHFAFSFAISAAAMDRPTTMFATGGGLLALRRDWSGLDEAESDAAMIARGVAGFDSLREAATSLDVRLLACEAALRARAMDRASLLEGVQVAGITTFLADLAGAQLVSF